MFETYAEQIASKCVHFTGIQKKQCVVGVAYDNFDGGLPCLANLGRGPKQPCSQIHFPTAEEIAVCHLLRRPAGRIFRRRRFAPRSTR